MNEAFYKYTLLCVKLLTKDSIRMSFKTIGVEFVPNVIASRNKREGFYAGKLHNKHYRSLPANMKEGLKPCFYNAFDASIDLKNFDKNFERWLHESNSK